MNRQDNRKRRLFSSMSFRINMVLIVVMIILGLSFTNVMTVIVGGVSNMSRMSTMEKVVKKDIEDNIKNVENVVNPPHTPAMRNVVQVGFHPCWRTDTPHSTPIKKHPARFTAMVPHPLLQFFINSMTK